MGTDQLLHWISSRKRGEAPASLDAYLEVEQGQGWGQVRTAVQNSPEVLDEEVLAWAMGRFERDPGVVFALLLDAAGKGHKKQEELVGRMMELMDRRPAETLQSAGWNLQTYGRQLIDRRWVQAALKHFDANPVGAWGMLTGAAWLAPNDFLVEDVDFLETRADTAPSEYTEVLFYLATRAKKGRAAYLKRALARFEKAPGPAVSAAKSTVSGEASILRAGALDAVIRHLESNAEKAWEFLTEAVCKAPKLFTDARLDAIASRAATGPEGWFKVLHRVAAEQPRRAKELIGRYVRFLPSYPKAALEQAKYLAHNDPEIQRQELLDAVAQHATASPYSSCEIFSSALHKRPELLHERHVVAALSLIEGATNWAFGFFRDVLKLRPEFTPLATLALFDCVVSEPPHRAWNRPDMIQGILTIAQASHVSTQLEKVLRDPPSAGSRRGRALMAILFRQRSRARQYVLFEALRFASTAITYIERNWTPLWDFFLFLIDESSDDTVSTAAAERFLEGAFQLHYLMDRGADHDEFRNRFDLREPAPAAWPACAACLERDQPLTELYRKISALASRLGTALELSPIEEFGRRMQSVEIELNAIETKITEADGKRRERLVERRKTLNRHVALWLQPSYVAALADPAKEAALTQEGRELAARERRDLAKHVRDGLRSELARIAVQAVDGSRVDLYRQKLTSLLGHPVDLSKVEPSILPSFLFFGHLGSMPNNRKYLARLLEDRIENRPHDWLWTEPPVLDWKKRLAEKLPGVRFEHWRAPLRKEVQYRPQDASNEKKRRIKEDLARVRELLLEMEVEGVEGLGYEALVAKVAEVRAKPPEKFNVLAMEEIGHDLERVKIVLQTPESDYEGRIVLEVETDPFEILFMGEYGFASCLSLRGVNVWSAVSNAIDIDKGIVWAKEGNGNVVGRRLIALTDRGLLSYRTYANRHGLSLDGMFGRFLDEYAERLGIPIAKGGEGPGPLLSDRWYDDGAI